MGATGFLDACGFIPVSGGTGNFVVSSAITGYQTPASAGAVDSTVYSYRAESPDKTQWEEGYDAYTVSTTTLGRTHVTANSSGGTSVINFSAAPNVFIVAASADLQNASLLTSGTLPNARLTAGEFPGTATNDNATAGNIGEFVSANVASGSAVSMASATPTNVTSISLTAGDWDVSGVVSWSMTHNASDLKGWISTTSATDPGAPNSGAYFEIGSWSGGIGIGGNESFPIGPMRLSLSTTTTVYLTAEHTSSGGSNSAYGFLRARRMR